MKKSIIAIISVIIVLGFFYGVSVGHYQIFPFDIIKDIKNLSNENIEENPLNTISQENISELIDIQNIDDIELKKSELIYYIWNNDHLPNHVPTNIENNMMSSNYDDIENLERSEIYEITMDYNVISKPELFLSQVSNNKLIIYHRGHDDGNYLLGKDTISYFLNKGYAVLAFSMPLVGENNQPIVDLDKFGKIKLKYHADLELLETSNFSPIKFFIEPIIVSLNYIDNNYNFDSIYMIGISGGGWTTTLSSAIDERISKSYSVAGTSPFFMKTTMNDHGDYEQRLASLYQITNYLELYTMASYGENRVHYQIFNKFDPCCFSEDPRLILLEPINQKLSYLSGNFEIWVDDTHKEHKISQSMHERILESLNEIS